MITNSSAYSTGSRVELKFILTQHSRDEQLMTSFIEYFGSPRSFAVHHVDFKITRSFTRSGSAALAGADQPLRARSNLNILTSLSPNWPSEICLSNTRRAFSSRSQEGVTKDCNKPNLYLNPLYVTGFADAESSFTVSIYKNETSKLGWRVKPYFSIELHKEDLIILNSIQSFFSVGTIRNRARGGENIYSVNDLKDLINIIIPHFDKHPLLTNKRADFELFKEVVTIMNNKEHLTKEGLTKIISIRASMNKGLSETLYNQFPAIVPVVRPSLDSCTILDSN